MFSDKMLESTLSQLLRRQGLKEFRLVQTDQVGNPPKCDLDVLLEVKTVRSAAVEAVLGSLAISVLQARQQRGSAVLVPLLVLERLGPKIKQAVRQFMAANAPDCAWGLVDKSGAARIVIPVLNVDVDEPGGMVQTSWPRRQSARLFSDLNQWMLKILLLADVPPSLWGGPRQQVATPTELHRVAGVSVEKAHQFFRAFEHIGLVRQTSHGLTVVRRKALAEMWLNEERSRSVVRMPVRWIFGEPSELREVFSKKDSPGEFAICGFEACRALGVLHAPVANREVYASGDPEAALAIWDLEACDERDAHFYLRRAPSVKSIMRGRVLDAGLPVVDVLQAALDVCNHPARGAEQAEYILDHVLGWRSDE